MWVLGAVWLVGNAVKCREVVKSGEENTRVDQCSSEHEGASAHYRTRPVVHVQPGTRHVIRPAAAVWSPDHHHGADRQVFHHMARFLEWCTPEKETD